MTDTVLYVEENAQLARIYARMPVDVQMSFTPDQMMALGLATYEPATPHKVAIRKTISVFGRHYYFALFAGKDRRRGRGELHHVADEFQADWRYLLMMMLIFTAALALLAVAALGLWSWLAVLVGGQNTILPPAINEFLAR